MYVGGVICENWLNNVWQFCKIPPKLFQTVHNLNNVYVKKMFLEIVLLEGLQHLIDKFAVILSIFLIGNYICAHVLYFLWLGYLYVLYIIIYDTLKCLVSIINHIV